MKEKLPKKLALKRGVTVDVVRVHHYVGKGAYRVEYAMPDGTPKGCLAMVEGVVFEETDYNELRGARLREEDRERSDDHHSR